MKNPIFLLLSVILVLGLSGLLRGDDDPKTVTLKGSLACAKCVLKEQGQDSCQSVLIVKDGDKTTNYYLTKNDICDSTHAAVCHVAKDDVTVTGTVMEKDGKKWITATKIEGVKTK